MNLRVRNVPKLRLEYDDAAHGAWPHVVKVSGGRTSGLMLFGLLEAGALKRERGDVVVFNNTSAEHPATYEFLRNTKEIVEGRYGVPFFWIERKTYEHRQKNGGHVRRASFKLVNPFPYSESNPDGYHHKGEVFEELLSEKAFLPTIHERVCTQFLKLKCTRAFLSEWFLNKSETQGLGHSGGSLLGTDEELYQRHVARKGATPRDIYLSKKRFIRECSPDRKSQKWSDYSSMAFPFSNDDLEGKIADPPKLGKGGMEFVSFVGLRSDESNRIRKMRKRNEGGKDNEQYDGEHVYFPLADAGIIESDIHGFWNEQNWDLDLNKDDNLSNCAFCFLKGFSKMQMAKKALEREDNRFKHEGTPCDPRWWAKMEDTYGKDMKAENREMTGAIKDDFLGFFGTRRGRFYKRLASGEMDGIEDIRKNKDICGVDPNCDCTD